MIQKNPVSFDLFVIILYVANLPFLFNDSSIIFSIFVLLLSIFIDFSSIECFIL